MIKFNIDPYQITMYDFVQHIKKYLNSDIKTIFEIGSLNGADALYLKEQFPNADVHAIEGLESNYNIYLTDLKLINTHNAIISSYDGTTNWHVKDKNCSHSIFGKG